MLSPSALAESTITIEPGKTYQTITGWEATAWLGQWGKDSPYKSYRDELIDKAVNELGLTRLRVSVRSGFERPEDDFALYQSGAIDARTWGSRRYQPINDNDDPHVADPKGFHWSELDLAIEEIVLPMRKRLAANGERLYFNLLYIDFGVSPFEHGHNPEEYAEFMSVAFQHMHAKYGFVPDSIEVKLEPDKQSDNWTPAHMANAIVAAGDRLAKEKFRPDFIAPSTMRAGATVNWVKKMMKANPRVTEYLTELCYHRYGNPTEQSLPGILELAQAHKLRTSMGEWLKPDYVILPYQALYNDLTQCNGSSWEQYTLGTPNAKDGGGYFTGSRTDPKKLELTKSARLLQQYFKYIRPGAVRIGAASSDPGLEAVAFINKGDRHVVVVKAAAGATFRVRGLPAARYRLVYTTSSQYAVRLPDVPLGDGELLAASIPAKGVVTIYDETSQRKGSK
ncbi:MAG TPA: hypothetical protein VNE39_07630 [Planctomycetota bacterium]|nr:hypothetical protein [Planctomycetota bacterium]